MKNDVVLASASDTEEDKASAPNKKKGIDIVGSASGVDNLNTSNNRQGIERIAKQLQTKMKSLTSQTDRDECCIYRVPNSLRKVKPEAYTPQLISIGPLHRDNEGLKVMKDEKLRYFKEFTQHYKMDDEEKIRYLVGIIQVKEKDIKLCYSEDLTKIESNDFIEMILLDAVFLIKFMMDLSDGILPTEMLYEIREDLMLLENQLPFFIIKEICEKVNLTCPDERVITFLDLGTLYLQMFSFSQGVRKQGVNSISIVQRSRHFTDLLRNLMLNEVIIKQRPNFKPIKLKYSAVMLRKTGVKFQATKDKCLVNIKFEKGVLKIPDLEIDYCFERLVRNIMALEQRDNPFEAYICNYIKFMDHLINSAEDVDLLVKKGIILHWLGDDAAVSNMINKLCENIGDTYMSCYEDICKDMNKHYENPWNHRRETLKLVYFNNVWRGTATVAATILVILTLIQTITSVKSIF